MSKLFVHVENVRHACGEHGGVYSSNVVRMTSGCKMAITVHALKEEIQLDIITHKQFYAYITDLPLSNTQTHLSIILIDSVSFRIINVCQCVEYCTISFVCFSCRHRRWRINTIFLFVQSVQKMYVENRLFGCIA